MVVGLPRSFATEASLRSDGKDEGFLTLKITVRVSRQQGQKSLLASLTSLEEAASSQSTEAPVRRL